MSKAYDIVMENRKKLVEKLIKNMERGDLIWDKGWDIRAMSPRNPVSNVSYLGGNRVRLMAEAIDKEYKDPRWLTFKQATTNGWSIKKGEKGTLCEKWIFTKKEIEIDEHGKETEKEIKLDKPLVNYFYVFNAEQIENIPELKLNNYTKNQMTEVTQDFIDSSECEIKEIAQDRAYYNPIKDEIVLPLRESFKSKENFLATVFHEMVHSTGHKDRLNRDLNGEFKSESYAREELIAELGSVFLQSKLNIKLEGEHFDNHSAYLKSWISILKDDPNELFRAAAQAEKASERLYERHREYELEQLKELSKSTERFKPHPLDSFSVHFHYAETTEFGDEDKRYRGVKAYEFIEKVIKFDKEYNKRRDFEEDISGYCKAYMTINLKGYSTDKIRIDLGDREFGGFDKVSDALEYRLKSFPQELIAYKNSYAKSFETTEEKIEENAKKILEDIDNSIKFFKEKEKIYLEEKEKTIKEDIKKENYNCLTGNRINVVSHSSSEDKWIAKSDVEKYNISVKEGAKSIQSEVGHIEGDKLSKTFITYYNISDLKITKEIEQKFVPMKEKVKGKEKDRGIER